MLDGLKRRVQMMIATGLVKLISDDKALQQLSVALRAGEEASELEHMLPYGFTHHPHQDTEAVVVFPTGDRSFGLVLAVADRRYRLKSLEQGEVALYDDKNQAIILRRNRVEVKAPQGLYVETPKATFTQDVDIKGECTINGIAFTPHTHGGVDTGLGSTKAPNR